MQEETKNEYHSTLQKIIKIKSNISKYLDIILISSYCSLCLHHVVQLLENLNGKFILQASLQQNILILYKWQNVLRCLHKCKDGTELGRGAIFWV
jgi:hypothetical protein